VSGKRAALALIAALLAFGYVFTMNPGAVDFRLYPGAKVNTSLALVLFLFFLAGFGLAVFQTAFKEALRSFQFWLHRKGDERREAARRLAAQGRGHALLGRTASARKLLRRAYRKSPEAQVALEMARAELADGRLPPAERRLKALLEDDPRNPEILALLLQAYRTRGDFEGQVAALSRWLDVEPDHRPSLLALRDLYRDAGNWSEAARVQERVVARTEARQARAAERRTLSELRWRQAANLPEGPARSLLEKVVADDEGFAPAHASLGERWLAAGDEAAAVRAWVRGYEATGQAALLLRAEEVLLERGQAEEMLKLYRKLGKKGGAAVLLRARLLLDLERSQEALRVLEDGRRGAEEATRAEGLLRGEALYRLGSHDQAARAFREGAFGPEGPVPLVFTCSACAKAARRWSPACPACGRVDTLELDLGALPSPPALPAPA
jgi:predicted Zn-dependent protease